MNNTEIVKVLNLLDKYDYDGAKLFLQEQLLKQENKEKYKRVAIIFCLMGIPVAYIGFGNLVTYLYPIFGLLGLFEIILIIKNSIAKKDKNWYK